MKYDIPGVKNKVCVITGGAGVIGTSLGLGLSLIHISEPTRPY